MKVKKLGLIQVTQNVMKLNKLLSLGIIITVVGAVISALLPPLVLEQIINLLTSGSTVTIPLAISYFVLLALTSILDSLRESLLVVFGQKITHGLRSTLCEKFSNLPADMFVKQEPGAVVSRFVNDVDTVESLFTSGIISMFADACKVISIFAILFIKNKGLALVLLLLTPLIFLFTRMVQKRMLAAQIDNRIAVEKATNHVPETIKSIRTIHSLRNRTWKIH